MLHFEGMFVVETQGYSGGVTLIWKNKEHISLKSFNKNHIDVWVQTKKGHMYRLTGIYGEPDRSKWKEIWTLIQNLAGGNTLPW